MNVPCYFVYEENKAFNLLQTLHTVPSPTDEVLNQKRRRDDIRYILRREKLGRNVYTPACLHRSRWSPD